uniref:Uncharacterized protein n=1 Tax=Ovis aries TaxID=9940 RepID=A0AC11DN37_SHEEP
MYLFRKKQHSIASRPSQRVSVVVLKHGPARRGGEAAAAMDVFLMIRRHKTTIFTDAKESSTVFELKRIVEGILKRPPDEQRLYKMRHSRPCASSPSPAHLSCRT